jgi:hypothetical protein
VSSLLAHIGRSFSDAGEPIEGTFCLGARNSAAFVKISNKYFRESLTTAFDLWLRHLCAFYRGGNLISRRLPATSDLDTACHNLLDSYVSLDRSSANLRLSYPN